MELPGASVEQTAEPGGFGNYWYLFGVFEAVPLCGSKQIQHLNPEWWQLDGGEIAFLTRVPPPLRLLLRCQEIRAFYVDARDLKRGGKTNISMKCLLGSMLTARLPGAQLMHSSTCSPTQGPDPSKSVRKPLQNRF